MYLAKYFIVKKQAKATENNEVENGTNIEDTVPSKKVQYVDEMENEKESAQKRSGRPKRGGGPAPGMTTFTS